MIRNVPNALSSLLRRLGPSAVRAVQNKKFRRQFLYAYHHVRAYRRICDRAGVQPGQVRGLADLVRLPFLDPSYVAGNPAEEIMARPVSEAVKWFESSGSAGTPKVIRYVREDLESIRGSIAFGLRALCGIGRDTILLNEFAYGLWPTGVLLHESADQAHLRCIAGGMNIGPVYQLQVIARYRPHTIAALPTYLLLLAEHAEGMGFDLKKCGVRKVIVGGEPTTRRSREEISRRYGAEVFNMYGLTEVGIGVAGECHRHEGMHTNANMFVEIIGEDGRPLPAGEEGEIVLTHLVVQGLPLIRYRTGDVSCILPGGCPCGLPTPRIRDIFHRVDDMLIISGANIYPKQIDDSIRAVVDAWELHIRTEGGIPVLGFIVKPKEPIRESAFLEYLVGNRATTPEVFRRVYEAGAFRVEATFADVPRDTSEVSGKRRFRIRRDP